MLKTFPIIVESPIDDAISAMADAVNEKALLSVSNALIVCAKDPGPGDCAVTQHPIVELL